MKLKKMPLTSDIVQYFMDEYNIFRNTYWDDVDTDVLTTLQSQIQMLFDTYVTLGCHVIGKWQYDEESEEYIAEADVFKALFALKLQKYKPYVKVFSDEFANISSTIQRVHSGSNDGVSRSASENSPITAAPITNAPTEASHWNIDNPNVKGGTQFNQHHSNTENVTDPRVQLEILKFNVDQLNLTTIANMIVRSVVEEYNTVY